MKLHWSTRFSTMAADDSKMGCNYAQSNLYVRHRFKTLRKPFSVDWDSWTAPGYPLYSISNPII